MARYLLEGGSVASTSQAVGRLISTGLLLAGLMNLGGVASSPAGEPRDEDAPAPGEGVSFSGRVVELEGGKPVAGATVVVSRSLGRRAQKDLPPWVGESTLRTDGAGRFTIAFPAEQVAEPGLVVTIARVEHPEFVSRKGMPVPLRSLLRGRRLGDKPYFDTITLGRGMVFSGQAVTPEGRPAAEVAYQFESDPGTNPSDLFVDRMEGRTGPDGRFRLRMPKTTWMELTLTSESYAPVEKSWGMIGAAKAPEVWVPADLGRIVLEKGVILSGRVLDLGGGPIAGQRIVAEGRRNRSRRTATTRADGFFTFAPLPPGNYDVFAERQLPGAYDVPTGQWVPTTEPVAIRPAVVYLKPGDEAPPPVELRELPTVAVEVRFVDSQGRPARGDHLVRLWGGIPSDGTKDGRSGPPPDIVIPVTTPDGHELEDMDKSLNWGCQLAADATGRVVFRAPKGLVDAHLNAFPPDETIAYKTRLVDGGPLKFWGVGPVGTLDGDRKGITIIAYRAPTVVVTVKTEGGEPTPADAAVQQSFHFEGLGVEEKATRQSDGRFRTRSLMPEYEYEFDAGAKGYVPQRLRRVNLPEGGTAELTLVIRKPRARLATGSPAPPFSVVTVDGRGQSLEGYRGKFVLLHFWGPFHGEDRDLPGLRTLHDRFGGDDRLAMLGFGLTDELEAASAMIKEKRLVWPQALMLDHGLTPVAMDYLSDKTSVPSTFLIDPDGTIVATGLSVADAEKWLTGVLDQR